MWMLSSTKLDVFVPRVLGIIDMDACADMRLEAYPSFLLR
jgi:hypothetical protein